MDEFEVMGFRKSRQDGFALAAETVSGNRLVIRQVLAKGESVLVKLADGTIAKPSALTFIKRFTNAKELQKFLLKQ